MEWKPNKQSDIPIYQQIANYIQKRIAYGEFPPGTLLPSERKLAKEFEVNRGTVVIAYDVLYSTGMIERVKGSGTKVHSDVWGLTRSRIPNWDLYVERGSFLPNLPLFQHIRGEIFEKDLINFASGELACDLMPGNIFKTILTQHDFQQPLGYEHPQGSLVNFSDDINTSTLKSMDQSGSVLYISSFSKILASGLRIGWIIGPDKIIQRLSDAKQQIDFGHSILPQ